MGNSRAFRRRRIRSSSNTTGTVRRTDWSDGGSTIEFAGDAAEELGAMLVGVREEFRKQFGREMRADDPLFWDPDLSEPTPISVEKIEAVTVDAMRIAGYPPAHIYAYQETGMLVSEENIDLFPDEDIDEYMAAMARYEALHA